MDLAQARTEGYVAVERGLSVNYALMPIPENEGYLLG